MKSTKKTTTVSNLMRFELSRDTCACYDVLEKNGALSADQIAREVGILPNSVYRLMRSLEKHTIVTRSDKYPTKFQAVPLKVAVTTLADHRITEMENVKTQVAFSQKPPKSNNPQTKLEILTGWKSMMMKYVELANGAKREILIISIGESVPDEVKLANRDAMERGVSIKFIAHTYNEKNQELLSSWIKMGVETRYLPESGYHLVVFDSATCMLTTSSQNNSQERTTVVMYGEGLSHAMRDHFYTLWSKAQPVRK